MNKFPLFKTTLLTKLFAVSLLISSLNFPIILLAEDTLEPHNVKYYYDTLEPYGPNTPREGFRRETIIRGRLIEVELPTQCKLPPCPNVKAFALQDIDNADYKIVIRGSETITEQLKIGKIYTLKGTLLIDVDPGHGKIYISWFTPTSLISVRTLQPADNK
jgi:hypothetical protein